MDQNRAEINIHVVALCFGFGIFLVENTLTLNAALLNLDFSKSWRFAGFFYAVSFEKSGLSSKEDGFSITRLNNSPDDIFTSKYVVAPRPFGEVRSGIPGHVFIVNDASLDENSNTLSLETRASYISGKVNSHDDLIRELAPDVFTVETEADGVRVTRLRQFGGVGSEGMFQRSSCKLSRLN